MAISRRYAKIGNGLVGSKIQCQGLGEKSSESPSLSAPHSVVVSHWQPAEIPPDFPTSAWTTSRLQPIHPPDGASGG